uniref:SEA domain-containing protein n=1 Tax=Lepisosteus oculatus TaxID=7918 RepID=W5LVV9_LEPOC
ATSPQVNTPGTPENTTSPHVNTTGTPENTSPHVNTTSTPENTTPPYGNTPGTSENTPPPHVSTPGTPDNATSPHINSTGTPENSPSPPANSSPPPPISRPIVVLQFSLNQDFNEDLKNKTSEAFQSLAKNITTQLDTVYRNKFGDAFNRTEITDFRSGSVIVDSTLIFNNLTVVPNTSEVTNTLKAAANTSGFSLPVNTSTIVASALMSTPEN